jgi:N-acetylmuramoyl-L-alanine amidase
MRICIDAGHGGSDPGAINKDYVIKEKHITLMYAQELEREFLRRGHDVFMTRDNDQFVALDTRYKTANLHMCDIFISIHANAFYTSEARGWEIWTSPGKTGADLLASKIHEEVEKAGFPYFKLRPDWTDGDVDKEAKFAVLMGTKMPAVLIELGFITNNIDLSNMRNKKWREKMVKAIADGAEAYAAEAGLSK